MTLLNGVKREVSRGNAPDCWEKTYPEHARDYALSEERGICCRRHFVRSRMILFSTFCIDADHVRRYVRFKPELGSLMQPR